jgi:hypothetical protein
MAMSERDDRNARHDLPSTTAEFRAAPDLSASTAEFKAFASAHDDDSAQSWEASSWPAQPAAGALASSGGGRKMAIIVGAVIVIAVIIAVVIGLG